MNEPIAALFASGHAADLVLLVLVTETVVLALLSRLRLAVLVAAALPGGLIVLALRAALLGQRWPMIALPLALSWPAHLWDVRLRLNQRR